MKQRIDTSFLENLFAAHFITPGQYRDMNVNLGAGPFEAEKRLILTNLQHAIEDYADYKSHNSTDCPRCIAYNQDRAHDQCKKTRNGKNALEWILDDSERVFSFRWSCDVLDVDANWLRAGILKAENLKIVRTSTFTVTSPIGVPYQRRRKRVSVSLFSSPQGDA